MYVCRDHLEPVNWRGKGCWACQREQRRREKRRKKPEEEES